MSVQDTAKELPDLTYSNITSTLKQMVDERQIEKAAKGLYSASSGIEHSQ
jgi:hypothetical protein